MAYHFDANTPIYLQLIRIFQREIATGIRKPGEKVDPVRDLALQYGVNPNTMQRALAELEEMGLVTTQRNTGRTVTTDEAVVSRARDSKANQLAETFMMQMQALGLSRKEVLERLAKGEHKEGEHAVNS